MASRAFFGGGGVKGGGSLDESGCSAYTLNPSSLVTSNVNPQAAGQGRLLARQWESVSHWALPAGVTARV